MQQNAGDPDWIPGWGRFPGGGNGNPLQYSCSGNPKNTGTWWAIVHGVANSQTGVSNNHHDILKIGLESGLVWTCKDHPMFLRYPTFITDPNKNYRHCQAFRFNLEKGCLLYIFIFHNHFTMKTCFQVSQSPANLKTLVALEAVKSSGGRDARGQQTLAPHQPSLLEAPVP